MDEEKKVPAQPTSDFDQRRESFVKEYGELVDKYKTDWASYPVYVPDGQGGFRTLVQNTPVDITNQPKKSPFVAE